MHDSRFWELIIFMAALGWVVFDNWRRGWYGNAIAMILAICVGVGAAVAVFYGNI